MACIFKRALARNTNINLETQKILANDKDLNVKTYLASNPLIDKEAQLILAKDENFLLEEIWHIIHQLTKKFN